MNRSIRLSLIVTLFILFCLAFFSRDKSYAQQVSLGIYPPITQIEINPPQNIQTPITLKNFTDNPLILELNIKQFRSSPANNGQITYTSSKQIVGADPTILQKLQILDNNQPVDQIILPPQDQKVLTFALTIPKQEPPSDYYFSLIFIAKSQQTNQNSGSLINAGIATNILISIGPKDKTTGYLQEFSSPLFLESGPVPFTILVQNTSKHFIVPEGTIIIKNMYKQVVGKVTLLPVNILSETNRFIPDMSFHSQDKAFWQEKFLFGSYTAELTIALSPDGPLYKKTIYFIAIPYQVLIGFIVACIFIALIIIRVRQKMNG